MKSRPTLAMWWRLSFMATFAAVTACSTLQVGSDYDRKASFTNYHTFTVMQRERRGVHNPLVTQRVEDAIKEDLTRKGYLLAGGPNEADFAVDFTVGTHERTDINSYPAPYAGRGWAGWGWGPGWWGGPYWGSDIDVRQVREGTLSIDVFDARTHRPVWHGWAKKELNRQDVQRSEEPIRKAVAAVLEKFPPTYER